MKTQHWALLLGLGLLVGLGCNDKEEEIHGGDWWPSVLIVMSTDTVLFLPGDSAIADGWVLVTDGTGHVTQDIEVMITLLEPFGTIELLNGTDSTDADGRVYFRFHSYNQTGMTTIRASVGARVDLWPLTVLAFPVHWSSLSLQLSRDTLWVAPAYEDSVEVTVTGVGRIDSTEQGPHGIIFPLRADGGRFNPIGPTDTAGTASTWWYSNGQYGSFHIWVAIDTFRVEDSVRVLPLEPVGGRGGS